MREGETGGSPGEGRKKVFKREGGVKRGRGGGGVGVVFRV